MRKTLLTDKPGIGVLSQFIDMLSKLQKEFKLETVEIGETTDTDRHMSAKLSGELGVIVLDYDYIYERFYTTIIHNDDKENSVQEFKKVLKDIVETPRKYL